MTLAASVVCNLMVVVPIVKFLVMIAHLFGEGVHMFFTCTVY